MYQGDDAKFDPKTEKFQTWTLPAEHQNDDADQHGEPAAQQTSMAKYGRKTTALPAIHRLDLATGKIETCEPFNGAPGEKP